MERSALLKTIRNYIEDERGLTAVEYAILLGVLVVGGIAAWDRFGTVLNGSVDHSTDTIAEISAADTPEHTGEN
jgi:Flp pilus assembly pilin Flp